MTVAIVAMAIVPSFVNAEHAIDASDHSTDTRAEGAADDASNRTCRATTFVRALRGSALNTPDNTLSVAYSRKRKQNQRRCSKRKAPICRGEHE
jgi:hypothetical protein